MYLLAIDTAANLCAATVLDTETGEERGRAVLDLGKGHAEQLMGVIGSALGAAGLDFADLGAVAVATGPGSFTGIRVGVAAARGLALTLKIPAIGVTTLEAIAAETRDAFPGRAVLAALDAGREEIHAALYDEKGAAMREPFVTDVAGAAAIATDKKAVLAGSAVAMIAAAAAPVLFDFGPSGATADIGVYARVAVAKGPSAERPKPVYLRGPDAKPQAGFVLPRKTSQ